MFHGKKGEKSTEAFRRYYISLRRILNSEIYLDLFSSSYQLSRFGGSRLPSPLPPTLSGVALVRGVAGIADCSDAFGRSYTVKSIMLSTLYEPTGYTRVSSFFFRTACACFRAASVSFVIKATVLKWFHSSR